MERALDEPESGEIPESILVQSSPEGTEISESATIEGSNWEAKVGFVDARVKAHFHSFRCEYRRIILAHDDGFSVRYF